MQQKLMSLKEIYINRGIEKNAIKVATQLIIKFPAWENKLIAEINGLKVTVIKKLKKEITKSKKENGQTKDNGK